MSSSRASHSQNPRRGRGSGVQVRTVTRNTPGSPSRSGRSRGSSSPSRSRSQPSARFRQALKKSSSSHAGDFLKDDESAREFANRVVEIYAPSTDAGTESVRQLPLNVQAKRDGTSFKLPTLGKMCLNIIAESFESHILPIRFILKDPTKAGNAKKENRSNSSSRGLLGIEVGGYNEEDDEDFVPDSDDESRRPKKKAKVQPKRIARKSETQANTRKAEFDEPRKERDMELLGLLPAPYTIALQEQLERKAPQLLNYEVMTHLFLSRAKVSRSKLFRVLAILNGINERDMIKLWQHLIYQDPLLYTNTIKRAIPDNAASTLRTLHLQAFTQLKTNQILDLFQHTRNLENVCLRGCVNIYPEAIAKLVETCGESLRNVNFNWTSIGLTGVEHLIRDAPNLQVLKVAHVKGLSDSSVKAMMDRIVKNAKGFVPLGKLERLKLHGTEIGIQGLGALLQHCGKRIRSLDIGSTRVGGTGSMELLMMFLGFEKNGVRESDSMAKHATPANMTLEKLNVSHLSISYGSADQLIHAVSRCKRLRKINLDHLSLLNVSSTVLSHLVYKLFGAIAVRALERRVYKDYQPDQEYIMDSVSFAFPNTYSAFNPIHIDHICLPTDESTVERPVNDKVIRSLNLRGIPFGLKSDLDDIEDRRREMKDLESQFAREGREQVINRLLCSTFDVQHLDLSHCRLPDRCDWQFFGISGGLRSIDLNNAHIDRESVDNLVQNNPYLERIDLTGCRSIPVTKRRNYL